MLHLSLPTLFTLMATTSGVSIAAALAFMYIKQPKTIAHLLQHSWLPTKKSDITNPYSPVYDSETIVHFRYNEKTDTLLSVNKLGASILGFTTPEEAIAQTYYKGKHITKEARDKIFATLYKHGEVHNYPITFNTNGMLRRFLLTARLDAENILECYAIDTTAHWKIYEGIEEEFLFLQSILNALPAPVFVQDVAHQTPFTNRAFNDYFGDTSEDFPKAAFRLAPEEDGDAFAAEDPHYADYITEFSTEKDTSHHFEVKKRPLIDIHGKMLGIVGIASDITDLKLIEQDLRDTTRRYKNIFWNAAEGMTRVKHDGEIIAVNPAMAAICGYDSTADFVASVPTINAIWRYPEDREAYLEALKTNKVTKGYEFEFIRKDGSFGWMMISASGTFDAHDNLKSIDTIVADITERKESEIQLTRCATIDSMTGIHNRRSLETHLEHLISHASPTPFAIIFIDLNKFKPINDQYGHHTGDSVLAIIANRLVQSCRKSDFTARLGGDEFVIVLKHVESKETLQAITEKLLASIEEPILLNGRQHIVSASAGISMYPQDGAVVIDLLKAADASMYEMKRNAKTSKINEQLHLLANC